MLLPHSFFPISNRLSLHIAFKNTPQQSFIAFQMIPLPFMNTTQQSIIKISKDSSFFSFALFLTPSHKSVKNQDPPKKKIHDATCLSSKLAYSSTASPYFFKATGYFFHACCQGSKTSLRSR